MVVGKGIDEFGFLFPQNLLKHIHPHTVLFHGYRYYANAPVIENIVVIRYHGAFGGDTVSLAKIEKNQIADDLIAFREKLDIF